jgi:hypothetical protein
MAASYRRSFFKFKNQKRFLFRPRCIHSANKQAQKSHATVPLNDEIMKRDDALIASLLHFFNFSPKLTFNGFIASDVASIALTL